MGQALFFNHLYDPISMVRDNEVKTAMASCGVACHTFNGDVLYEPWELLSATGQPLDNFNDYWDRHAHNLCTRSVHQSSCGRWSSSEVYSHL